MTTQSVPIWEGGPPALAVPWEEAPFVVCDLEGTGPQEGDQEGIVELALVPLQRGQSAGLALSTLVNPQRKIPWVATRVHGIRNADVMSAPTIDDLADQIRELVDGRAFVAHNARVDWNLLSRLCPGLAPLCVIDTLRLARAWYPELRGRGLSALVEQFGLAEVLLATGSQPHRAGYDAAAAGHVLHRMLSERAPEGTMLADLCVLAGIDRNPVRRPTAEVAPETDAAQGELPLD